MSKFNESEHPRDGDGKFTSGSGDAQEYRQNMPYGELKTPQEREIEAYMKSVDPGLVAFAERAKADKTDNKSEYVVAKVSDRARKDIENLTGETLRAKEFAIRAGTIRHIEERHGREGKADRFMSDVNDIARMAYVLENYDSLDRVVKKGEAQKSKGYLNGKGKNADLIRYQKVISSDYFVVFALTDTDKGILQVISAYQRKKDG